MVSWFVLFVKLPYSVRRATPLASPSSMERLNDAEALYSLWSASSGRCWPLGMRYGPERLPHGRSHLGIAQPRLRCRGPWHHLTRDAAGIASSQRLHQGSVG